MFFAGQSLPPRSSNSTPISQQGSMNPSMSFTSSPNALPSQNPLSLIMSQMSKYAMPSSTPLYHDAIKTIATSDDEMLPERPLLAGVSIAGRKRRTHYLTENTLYSSAVCREETVGWSWSRIFHAIRNY